MMTIHFRRAAGKRTAYLELPEEVFCGFGTGDYLTDLPGKPLKYSDMDSTLIKRLRENHFLDVTAKHNETKGIVKFRLPDPVTLLKTTRPGEWKHARDQVMRNSSGMREYQAFAQWWECLRRSDAYRRDCEAIRLELAWDRGLIWAAFVGWTDGLLAAGSETLETRRLKLYKYIQHQNVKNYQVLIIATLNCYASHYWLEDPDINPRDFRYTWSLPEGKTFPLLWPKEISAVDLGAFYTLTEGGQGTISYPCGPQPGPPIQKDFQGKPILQYFPWPAPEKIDFRFPCEHGSASSLVTELFKSGLIVDSFKFESRRPPYYKDGIFFSISTKSEPQEEAEASFPSLQKKVIQIITETIGKDLPKVKSWNQRRRLNPQTFRRELAAFDKRTDEDAELWPDKASKKELDTAKSRARTRFVKNRLAPLEQAAEIRRRALAEEAIFSEMCQRK